MTKGLRKEENMFDKSCLMENMSWVEIDKAMKAGKKTVVIGVGAIEQHGPGPVSYTHLDVYKRQCIMYALF